jgi:hypothetical protein
MTDGLTDAVRRIKGLQRDVEQLKSAREQEGVPLIVLQSAEQAVASDAQAGLVNSDLKNVDVATATDAQAGLVASDLNNAETATAADVQDDLRLQRTIADATYNNAGYVTSTHNK